MESEEILDGEGRVLRYTPALASPPPRPFAARNPVRMKRPRITATDALLDHPPGRPIARKRIKRPADFFPPAAPGTRVCAFCSVPGHQPECEGSLIGPIRPPNGGKAIYVHRNCALWSPEVWQGPKNGKLMGVHAALLRAKKFKCIFCQGSNPSLSCMFLKTACCKPMHFRCALLAGATLIAGYQTFCPKHANRNPMDSVDGVPPSMELYHERTPIDLQLIMPGAGCNMCDGDSYDSSLGAILTCSSCSIRHHTKCMWPTMEKDGGFSALSWQGKYLCKDCMKCVSCQQSIDKDVYNTTSETGSSPVEDEAFNGMVAEGRDPECDSVKCLGCNHFVSHIACLPPGSMPDSWRCDLCLTCKHCSIVDVPRSEWNERWEACAVCATEIRKGGVVCPMCQKVYREGENIPMVQCDYCDKWLHALECAGMTHEKFKKLEGSDVKYRCPICTTEKKKRDQNTKQNQSSKRRPRVNGFGKTRHPFNLSPVYSQIPCEEVVFHSVRKISDQGDSLDQVFEHLSPDVELCRLCCSSGQEENFLFCTDCGECYHDFCYASGAASPFSKTRAVRRSGSGGSMSKDRPWRCLQCEGWVDLSSNELMRHMTQLASQALEKERNFFQVVRTLASDHSSTTDVDVVTWRDDRKCELCMGGEEGKAREGRLIPWASNNDSIDSHCWVHIGCVLWSVSVTPRGGENSAFDFLLGPRRKLLHFAKQRSCSICLQRGATLHCSAEGCNEFYHFRCAIDAGVGCFLRYTHENSAGTMVNGLRTNAAKVNMRDVQTLLMFCPTHRAVECTVREGVMTLMEALESINLRRVVRIFDTTDFSKKVEAPKKKSIKQGRLLSIRIGSLSVLQFGRLVPEVNDFIVKGCLVPIGFCAARRFWSIVNPGKRCLYFFEVCGYPQSGPVFVIRCSDSVSEKFESKDPDIAWSQVTERVKKVRRIAGLQDPSGLSFHTSGLEAFGLANCIPVVTHIESLPMASMFAGRYSLKRVATHRSNEIVFYNSLAKKYVPVDIRVNESGSARAEGYVSASWARRKLSKATTDVIPSYKNARTGAAFQLQVARDIFSRNEHIAPRNIGAGRSKFHRNGKFLSSKSTATADRSRANKSMPRLPYATQHRCIASTSRSRTEILRSDIDGWGVFATKDIPSGEMVIEYVGEIIRPAISDLREAQYLEQNIGCYMFEIEPGVIVDATMRGNAARYINHSCAPNCYSKTITTENGRKVVVIFAKRNIQRGEELSYDYQFPFDDSDRVRCACGTERCKGWMN